MSTKTQRWSLKTFWLLRLKYPWFINNFNVNCVSNLYPILTILKQFQNIKFLKLGYSKDHIYFQEFSIAMLAHKARGTEGVGVKIGPHGFWIPQNKVYF